MSLDLKQVFCQILKKKKKVRWSLELGIESDKQLQGQLFKNICMY